jgi:hypothetical protein
MREIGSTQILYLYKRTQTEKNTNMDLHGPSRIQTHDTNVGATEDRNCEESSSVGGCIRTV